MFTESYTGCPLCAPSRASMFSGLRPDTVGVTTLAHKLRGTLPHLITLPQCLRQRGWHTARAGKVFHMGVPDTIVVRGDGADDPYAWDDKVNCPGYELNSDGFFHDATPWETNHAGAGGGLRWIKTEKPDRQQHDHQVATEISRRITEAGDQPFFLAAGFIRPHVPFVAPKRFFDLYDPNEIDLPQTPAGATPLADGSAINFDAKFNVSPEDHRGAIAAYLACVSFADEQVGRLLDALDASGKAEDTLIVLTADHGYQMGEHGMWFKNFLYRESARVPLILCDPRRPDRHGGSCAALVENVDIYPTLMELLDQQMPHEPEGNSFVGVMTRENTLVCSMVTPNTPWPGSCTPGCTRAGKQS